VAGLQTRAQPAGAASWVSDPARIGQIFADLRSGDLSALAVSLGPAGVEPPQWLAICPQSQNRSPSRPIVFAGTAGLDPLLDWLSDPEAPYAIFYSAHECLSRLVRHASADWAPTRYGCIKTAAALIAEGTRAYRELPELEALALRLLGIQLPPEASPCGEPPSPESVAASSARVEVMLPLMQDLTQRLRQRTMIGLFQLECRLLPAVIAMERAGMPVDSAAFQRIVDDWQRERTATDDPRARQRLDKLLSTYGYWPREYIRGDRIHCRLHPLATDSGRFSCTDPNLQQVPTHHTAPGLRACFRPPPGRVLIIADYAQIELRVAAHLAPCAALRSVFQHGRDPHTATAATLTHKAEAEVSARERQLAKAVNFGFIFGMGPARFAHYARDSYGVELSLAEARRAREAFFETFPGIAAWHRRVATLGRGERSVSVQTVMGRRKRFEAGHFNFAAALNIPVQGTAAEGFKRAMTRLHPQLRALGGTAVLCVHDEYIAEVPATHADGACTAIASTMQAAMGELVPSVPIVVEAIVAPHWAAK
jgi:hypothetical protein